jgi:hypothetical protein
VRCQQAARLERGVACELGERERERNLGVLNLGQQGFGGVPKPRHHVAVNVLQRLNRAAGGDGRHLGGLRGPDALKLEAWSRFVVMGALVGVARVGAR